MKLKFMLLASILLLTVIAISAEPVEALPFDYEYTDQNLAVGEHSYLDLDLTAGDTVRGYFETDSTTMGLDFFIADEANYLIWDGGGSGEGYEIVTNMHTNYFELTVDTTDTWYLVFWNDDTEVVWFDVGVDVNDDNTPFYSSSSYDFTAYGEVLEDDEWYYAFGEYYPGTVFTGHYSTFFSTDGVDFFICDEENYEIWQSGGTADVYGLKNDYHQANIDSFTVPYYGNWYFVFSAVGETDTVTLSVGIDIDTSDANTDIVNFNDMMLLAVGAIALLVILVVCVVCSKRKSGPSTATTPTYQPPPPGSGTNKEMVLGALRAYPRVSMSELSNILNIPEDEVRRLTLRLIASEEIKGTFDKNTDEFTSVHASKVGSELRRDAKDELDLQRCPNCGAPIRGHFVVGDDVHCDSCGITFNV